MKKKDEAIEDAAKAFLASFQEGIFDLAVATPEGDETARVRANALRSAASALENMAQLLRLGADAIDDIAKMAPTPTDADPNAN